MNVSEHIDYMRAVAAAYEEKLADNPDFQAWKAINEAIAKIERAAQGTKVAQQPRKRERPKAAEPSRLDLVAELILSAGAPLSTNDLIRGLEARGFLIEGKDPAVNLASSLSRSDRFKSILYKGGKGWWLTDRAVPSTESKDLLTNTEDNE